MGRETLSVKQANRIIDTANEIYKKSVKNTHESFDEFLNNLSQVWEDKNAVALAGKVNDSFQEIQANITKNNQIFGNAVREIAEMFIKTGGMQERVSAQSIGFVGNLDTTQVKEYFENSENSDDFGFLDIETSPTKIMEALEKLDKKTTTISTEAVDSIKGIPAFGNTNIKMQIAKSAGKVVEIMREGISQVAKSTSENLAEAAKAYGIAGNTAIEAIGGIGGKVGEAIGGLGDKPVQAKYAPVPKPPVTRDINDPSIGIVPPPEPQTKYAPPIKPPVIDPGPQTKYAPPLKPPAIVDTPQTKYAPPPKPPVIEVNPPQTKYAPPPKPPVTGFVDTPQTKYAPPSMNPGGKKKKGK